MAIPPTAPKPCATATATTRTGDSHFYYLSAFTEPEAVLVLVAGAEAGADRSILFCRPKHEEREIWDGFRYGPEGALAAFGFDEAHSVEELDARLPALLADRAVLAYPLAASSRIDRRVRRWLDAVRALSRSGVAVPATVLDLHNVLDEMRLFRTRASWR